eukprot:gene2784-3405_t
MFGDILESDALGLVSVLLVHTPACAGAVVPEWDAPPSPEPPASEAIPSLLSGGTAGQDHRLPAAYPAARNFQRVSDAAPAPYGIPDGGVVPGSVPPGTALDGPDSYHAGDGVGFWKRRTFLTCTTHAANALFVKMQAELETLSPINRVGRGHVLISALSRLSAMTPAFSPLLEIVKSELMDVLDENEAFAAQMDTSASVLSVQSISLIDSVTRCRRRSQCFE